MALTDECSKIWLYLIINETHLVSVITVASLHSQMRTMRYSASNVPLSSHFILFSVDFCYRGVTLLQFKHYLWQLCRMGLKTAWSFALSLSDDEGWILQLASVSLGHLVYGWQKVLLAAIQSCNSNWTLTQKNCCCLADLVLIETQWNLHLGMLLKLTWIKLGSILECPRFKACGHCGCESSLQLYVLKRQLKASGRLISEWWLSQAC